VNYLSFNPEFFDHLADDLKAAVVKHDFLAKSGGLFQ